MTGLQSFWDKGLTALPCWVSEPREIIGIERQCLPVPPKTRMCIVSDSFVIGTGRKDLCYCEGDGARKCERWTSSEQGGRDRDNLKVIDLSRSIRKMSSLLQF